jgi:hypothetical protein
MTQNKMIQPDTTRHQEEREELARNQKGRIRKDIRGWTLFVH